MSFIIICMYKPPSVNDTFYKQITEILKECNHNKEIILMGDFNLNWEDKVKRKKLKTVADKYLLSQIIKGPTRIAKSSNTQLDLIFTNKPERIIKSYNLITGLSDHSLSLVARKLTRNKVKNNAKTSNNVFCCIPKGKLVEFNEETVRLTWDDILSSQDVEYGCNTLINRTNSVRDKFTTKVQKKNQA